MKSNQVNYLEGYEHAILNSKSLLKIATSACRQKEFGIACSLNVLAAEEAIKSFILIFKHYFPLIELPDFNDFFTKHKTKHDNLKSFYLIYIVFMEYIVSIYKEHQETYDEYLNKPSSKSEADVQKAIKMALHDKRLGLSPKEMEKWLSNANNQKNNGFYVNIINDVWKTPKSLTKSEFENEKKYTQSIQAYIQLIAKDLKKEIFLKEVTAKFAEVYIPKV